MSFIESATVESVTTITLNRPEKLNAFTGTMREELLAALRSAEGRVVVITGAGRAFCAGGDVDYMSGLQKRGDVEAFRKLLDAGRDVVLEIAAMRQPVIGFVNGIAAGAGCNLALACDYRIASPEAKLAQTFVRIGMHPDWGGTWLLPRLVGRSRALEILMTGRMVDAEEALRIGMIDRIGTDATELARSLAGGPPLAIAGIKRALRESERNDLAVQLELEARNQVECFESGDAAEGMAAFFQKRAPKF
jgi:enoyl-CoA hydratase/carnithine racemase